MKAIIIETPTTDLDLYNLSNQFNEMRRSAKKTAIAEMLESMACEHGYIVIENKMYYFNGERLIRNYELSQCSHCTKAKCCTCGETPVAGVGDECEECANTPEIEEEPVSEISDHAFARNTKMESSEREHIQEAMNAWYEEVAEDQESEEQFISNMAAAIALVGRHSFKDEALGRYDALTQKEEEEKNGMNQYWRHKTSGDVYAVQIVNGEVCNACGELHHSEVTEANLNRWNFNSEPELAVWIQENAGDFTLHEAREEHHARG